MATKRPNSIRMWVNHDMDEARVFKMNSMADSVTPVCLQRKISFIGSSLLKTAILANFCLNEERNMEKVGRYKKSKQPQDFGILAACV